MYHILDEVNSNMNTMVENVHDLSEFFMDFRFMYCLLFKSIVYLKYFFLTEICDKKALILNICFVKANPINFK